MASYSISASPRFQSCPEAWEGSRAGQLLTDDSGWASGKQPAGAGDDNPPASVSGEGFIQGFGDLRRDPMVKGLLCALDVLRLEKLGERQRHHAPVAIFLEPRGINGRGMKAGPAPDDGNLGQSIG